MGEKTGIDWYGKQPTRARAADRGYRPPRKLAERIREEDVGVTVLILVLIACCTLPLWSRYL